MIYNFLNMDGYGLYVFSSFIFTFVSFAGLYLIIKSQLIKEQKKFKNTVILGVSIDSQERHQKFIEKYDLPFTLLADTDKKVVQKYGVWQEKKLYGKTFMGIVRTTFLIDKTGTVKKIFPKVKVKTHIEEVLKELKEL